MSSSSRERFDAAYDESPYSEYPREIAWAFWQAAERATAQRCRELCMDRWHKTVRDSKIGDDAYECMRAIVREFNL